MVKTTMRRRITLQSIKDTTDVFNYLKSPTGYSIKLTEFEGTIGISFKNGDKTLAINHDMTVREAYYFIDACESIFRTAIKTPEMEKAIKAHIRKFDVEHKALLKSFTLDQ